jgi:hypothetical protein
MREAKRRSRAPEAASLGHAERRSYERGGGPRDAPLRYANEGAYPWYVLHQTVSVVVAYVVVRWDRSSSPRRVPPRRPREGGGPNVRAHSITRSVDGTSIRRSLRAANSGAMS